MNSKRIAKAVDNEGWQEFRVSMKGKSTQEKVYMLKKYYEQEGHVRKVEEWINCDICVRVDNYIKALCRGGLLYSGESLHVALETQWELAIKK